MVSSHVSHCPQECLIDNIFSNDVDIIDTSEVLAKQISDHQIIFTRLIKKNIKKKIKILISNLSAWKADFKPNGTSAIFPVSSYFPN